MLPTTAPSAQQVPMHPIRTPSVGADLGDRPSIACPGRFAWRFGKQSGECISTSTVSPYVTCPSASEPEQWPSTEICRRFGCSPVA